MLLRERYTGTCFIALWLLVMVPTSTYPTARSQDVLRTDRPIDFEKDVFPILSKHCFSCHGKEKQESGLRLDRKDRALLGGDSGKAIVIRSSDQSKLIQYVSGKDEEHVMPPEGERLTGEEIDRLRKWIDQGLDWPDNKVQEERNLHWAYQPLVRPKVPSIDSTWGVNPIDRFVQAKLQEKGLQPSAEANRNTLIRRATLDLIGLLPTMEEVDRFVNDKSPNAYEKVIDRLLESPHFGERWGRHWLDMARYADSDGYEKDNARPDAYRWRDWVIDAIQRDLPFDQFTIEQLAGDLLPNATSMQKLATAFHRQTLTNTEGGTDQEQFRVEACFDRTETTGSVWLGLTVGCARCHSHKYDAISQREYYQLFAFFNNADEQSVVVPKSESEIQSYQKEKEAHDLRVVATTAELRNVQEEMASTWLQLEEKLQATLAEDRNHPVVRNVWNMTSAHCDQPGVSIESKKGNQLFVSGENPDKAVYDLFGRQAGSTFQTLRLEVLPEKSLPGKGPGRSKNGNFVISEVEIEISETEDFKESQSLVFASAKADHEQPSGKPFVAAQAIDGKLDTGWAIAPQMGKEHWLELSLKEPLPDANRYFYRVRIHQLHGDRHTLGSFRMQFQSRASQAIDVPQKIAKILDLSREQRSTEQKQELLDYLSLQEPKTKKLVEKLESLKKEEPAKPELSARVLAERLKEPRTTYVLRRGEFLEPLRDTAILPNGLEVLPPLASRHSTGPADRLDFAKWLVSSDNPLTPRVTVNHFWKQLFGSGLVRTPNDFGVRGEMPTHPELLDWLACEFIGKDANEEGSTSSENRSHQEEKRWSRKRILKTIMMSATYRQESKLRSDLRDADPQNLWLARQNRLRVEGELVRDLCLDAAGLLSKKVGGPSVYPLLPAGIAELSYAGNFKWKVSDGEDRYRRGMYTFFKRTSPHPNLITFDCPDANLACVDRNRSNTPLQALITLNNESFSEAACAFAKRLIENSDGRSDPEKIKEAFRIALARSPLASEWEQANALLMDSRQWYREHPEEAKKWTSRFPLANLPVEEYAAWVALARIIINLDEFITRE